MTNPASLHHYPARLFVKTVVLSALFLSCLILTSHAGFAANFSVSNGNDTGNGSLRAAISQLNASTDASNDIYINIPNANPFTVTLASGELIISKNVTIHGSSLDGSSYAVVQRSTATGTPNFRIFRVNSSSVTVTFKDLIVQNGVANLSGGGGLFIVFGSNVTFDHCIVTGNSAGSGSSNNTGGGIFNSGTMSLLNTVVSNNSSDSGGGGIFNSGGTLNVNNSAIINNASKLNDGGGINSAGTLTLTNSIVTGNGSASGGGGIHIASGTAKLNNATIVFNSTASQFFGNGGGVLNSGGTLNVNNTIIARNSIPSDSNGKDIFGALNSGGYNLFFDTAGATIMGNTTGNLTGVDPRLSALYSYTNEVPFYALLEGSPAIDAGGSSTQATDERGQPRAGSSADGNNDGIVKTDIGAFEFQKYTVVNVNQTGAGSLAQAITDNNKPSMKRATRPRSQ